MLACLEHDRAHDRHRHRHHHRHDRHLLERGVDVAELIDRLVDRLEVVHRAHDRGRAHHGGRTGRAGARTLGRAADAASVGPPLAALGQAHGVAETKKTGNAGRGLGASGEGNEAARLVEQTVRVEDLAVRGAEGGDVSLGDLSDESTEMDLSLLAVLAVGEAGNEFDTAVEGIGTVESANEILSTLHAGKGDKTVLAGAGVNGVVGSEENLGANAIVVAGEFLKHVLVDVSRETSDENVNGGRNGRRHHHRLVGAFGHSVKVRNVLLFLIG